MPITTSEYERCRLNLQELVAWFESHTGDRNEATTRLQLVDRLFFDCLGWDRSEGVLLEDEENQEYADYLFTTTKDVLVVEAKREGKAFELPAGSTGLKYSIPSLMRDYKDLKGAIRQVASYCWERGVPYAAVCNGHQLVAFVATRSDGVPPLDGHAQVFPSLQFMLLHFLDLWQVLSKPGIIDANLYVRLVGNAFPDLPPKLSASLGAAYPGTKERNVFQTDLLILSELVIEDATRSPEVEETFLRECYCSSEALSQYSQLSRDVLSARYAALFDAENPGPATTPVRTTKGVSRDLLAETLSRRPILLIGDRGVGKTSFQRHLIRIDASDLLANSFTFYVNLGVRGTLSPELKTLVISEIEAQLLNEQSINIHDREFLANVYFLELSLFKRGNYGDLEVAEPAEYAKERRKFLEKLTRSRNDHLRRSLDHISKSRRRQLVLFLDNVDQREQRDQEQAFLIAQELADNWGITVYLPIRPETFHHSKKFGALSGYHAKAFTISPPRVEEMLEKRLRFALKITTGQIPLSINDNVKIDIKFDALDAMINSFLLSIEFSDDIIEALDNVASGDNRLVIDLVKQFFGSGHVDTRKIYNKWNLTKEYFIPLHEFLRALIFGDTVYYDPGQSPIVNLFDASWPDPKAHFLLSLLIASVQDGKTASSTHGFVESKVVYQKLQGFGFIPEQIDQAISRATEKRLLEAPARRVSRPGYDIPKVLRATAFGLYHINRLTCMFTYIDAITIDIPIFDEALRKHIRVVEEGTLEERIKRATDVIQYLGRCWKAVPALTSSFDWSKISASLATDIERVRVSSQKQQARRLRPESR